MVSRRRVALGVKRAMDVVGATLGLILISPALAAIAVAVRATLGRPVLFRQERPGLGGKSFTIVKFRTMRQPRPGEVWYLTDEQRVTKLGSFLRTTSLDELPELWNVLRGEMSLVGPRPLLVEYLETYTVDERRRHDMRPGVTGWTAVNGRHQTTFAERLELDLWYVDHWSLGLDVKILARTLWQVLRREGTAATEDRERVGFPVMEPRAHSSHACEQTVTNASGGSPSTK